MKSQPQVTSSLLNRLFSVLSGLGVIIMLVGLGLDLLPGSSPGISFPQLMLIIGGLALFIIGWVFKRASTRQSIAQDLLKNLLISFIIFIITLIVLEIGLTLANVDTRYPPIIPDTFLEAVPWWTCNESGCHYDYENMVIACNNKEVSGRRCMVNQQGFHDDQEFIMNDDLTDTLRVLMLGDSFTFGGAAQIGSSFVETLETELPDATIWNTGIPGAGTNQALATLETYAPIMNPDVIILGFYMNDFEDNTYPVDSYFMGVDDTNYPLAIRQYMLDDVGQITKLASQSDLYYRYHQVDPPTTELQRIVGTTRLGSLSLNTIDAIDTMMSKVEGKRINKQVEVTREYLIALRDYIEAQNIDWAVLVIPRREDISTPGTLYQNALQLFQELKIPYFDVRGKLNAEKDYAAKPDIHWSTEGHQIVGQLLAECLDQFENSDRLTDCEHVTLP
jgi:hypothetical protein